MVAKMEESVLAVLMVALLENVDVEKMDLTTVAYAAVARE